MLRKLLQKLLKTEHKSSQAADQPLDVTIEKVIADLTRFRPGSGYPISTELSVDQELKKKDRFRPIPIDEKSEAKIKELTSITSGIETRLITSVPFDDSKKYKVNYHQDLNPQQLAAVAVTDVPLLVIAGAGSGKTRVITYKVAWLVENGVTPDEIVLLTFTRKAANEMLSRVEKLLADRSAGNVLGGTFHGFSNYVLRRYGSIIGVPSNFSIIDPEDCADIIDLLKTELNIAGRKDGPSFPKKDKIQTIFSRSRNLELSIDFVVNDQFPENLEYLAEIKLLAEALSKFKKASNLLDYDDLMSVLRDGLRDNESFRLKVLKSIKYILVDEYQDTNICQREIVELLASEHHRVTVVGDDSQSIYGFRGSNFEDIIRFPQRFPACGSVMLEQNNRSDQGILDFCNDIIANAKLGFKKKLYSKRETGRKPVIQRFADGQAEATFIVDKMLEIRANDLEYNDFAVLTRASWHSNYVQAELVKRGIPFVVFGGIKFSERRHIRDIVSLVKITINPLDAVAWHRVLRLIEGIGKIRAKEIVDVVHLNHGYVDFSAFSNRKYYPELKTLQEVLNGVINEKCSVAQTIQALLDYYKPILEKIEDDYDVRVRDLEVFSLIAASYNDLEKFLADFTLEPPSNRYQNQVIPMGEPDEKPLVVSTIHSAKGLEWHTVFIPFALDGFIPSVRSMKNLEELEEERRLFYVACSRAMENLFITMPAFVTSYNATFTLPSRFLYNIDQDHYSLQK